MIIKFSPDFLNIDLNDTLDLVEELANIQYNYPRCQAHAVTILAACDRLNIGSIVIPNSTPVIVKITSEFSPIDDSFINLLYINEVPALEWGTWANAIPQWITDPSTDLRDFMFPNDHDTPNDPSNPTITPDLLRHCVIIFCSYFSNLEGFHGVLLLSSQENQSRHSPQAGHQLSRMKPFTNF